MNFPVSDFPSILKYIPSGTSDIDGEDALYIYELYWEDLKSVINDDEKETLDILISKFGSGVFLDE